ncbi:hypothetical protein NKH89_10070 [Mesorhizobium sp. M0923]|uniref:hypothetical protein n=1 Tax=unclassified Mesorhizobium TaxID=325217 RepID=UPI00333DF4AD
MEDVKGWVQLLGGIMGVLSTIYVIVTKGSTKAQEDIDAFKKSTDAKFDELEKGVEERWARYDRDQRLASDAIIQRFGMLDMQMAKFDEALKHLPDREQSHRLEIAIEKLGGRMEAMDQRVSGRIETLDERLKPVSAISDRLQEFLLEQARK